MTDAVVPIAASGSSLEALSYEFPVTPFQGQAFSGSFDFAPFSFLSERFWRRFAQDDRYESVVPVRSITVGNASGKIEPLCGRERGASRAGVRRRNPSAAKDLRVEPLCRREPSRRARPERSRRAEILRGRS